MQHGMGEPLPFGPKPVELKVAAIGNYDAHDGFIVVLSGEHVVIRGDIEGAYIEFGVKIEDMLDSIGKFNHMTGN